MYWSFAGTIKRGKLALPLALAVVATSVLEFAPAIYIGIRAVCDLLPKSICGDPRFIGADGNTFYFHGKKDQDFCILSDNDLHINAHFIGKHNPENNRDFTWVQALGIIFGNNHKLYIGVQKTMTWDDSIDRLVITFNGEHIHIPTEIQANWVSTAVPSLSLTRTSATNGIMAELKGGFTIMMSAVPISKEESESHNYGVTPDNSLAHLDLSFKFYSLTDDVHGVLGQTHRSDYVNKLDVRKKMPLMTGEAKYSSSSIFATDCEVSRFQGKPCHQEGRKQPSRLVRSVPKINWMEVGRWRRDSPRRPRRPYINMPRWSKERGKRRGGNGAVRLGLRRLVIGDHLTLRGGRD